jgi:hypothetical protein
MFRTAPIQFAGCFLVGGDHGVDRRAGADASFAGWPSRAAHVARELDTAAAGGDTADVSVALCMVLSIEGIECRTK